MRRIPVLALAVTACVFSLCLQASARETGADDGRCGDPVMVDDCTRGGCHTTYPVNSGGGLLTINNVPASYVPGASYNLEVMLADPGMLRWGFQVTVLDGANQMAGAFTVTDAVNTWLSDNAGTLPDYLNHTLTGTYGGTPDGPVYWDFDWTAPPTPAGMVTFYLAGCAADSNVSRTNDYVYTYTVSAAQAVRDVAVVSLDNPPDSICVDTLYAVQATVTNNGDQAETFDVVATIDPSGYADTAQVSLAVGQTSQVTFGSWLCPPTPDIYTYTVTAILTGDATPGDNSMNKQMDSYYCAIHDAAAVAIASPPDSICTNSTYPPAALITNLGNVPENIDVACFITPSGYGDTAQVRNVAPAETALATFANWVVPASPDAYTIVVKTLLANDMFTANDSTDSQSISHDCTVHDVGVMSLISPPLEVCTDSTYTPAVQVVNYGNTPEGFDVELTIGAGYVDSFFVAGIQPGDTALATFSDWTVPSIPDAYDLLVSVAIPDDANPSNDSLSELVAADSCFQRDLGVVSVLSPGWWVCTDSIYPVSVRVINNGVKTETFQVGFLILPYYDEIENVFNLAPGSTYDVDFRSWATPSTPDTLYLDAALILAVPDSDPTNDFVFDSTFVFICPGIAESTDRRARPASTGLLSVFPSPSRGPVRFHYSVEHACPMRLDILDTSGRVIRSVHQSDVPAGFGEAVWDLTSDSGERAGGGVYFARLSAGETVSLRKFIVVR
jgi:hypothetical protein